VPEFLRVPMMPEPLVLSTVDPSMLAGNPDRLLGLAHLLLSGDTALDGEYLDLLEHTGKIPADSRLAARFAAFQSFRYAVAGQLERAVRAALTARASPEVSAYLVEHPAELRPDPFIEQLITATLEVRATQDGAGQAGRVLAEPLTVAGQRVLTLLPTSTHLQISDILYVSRNTVKTHLRSIYRKLGAASRSQALQRAVDLRLL
jgi:hypothetical protein